jgi:hypothetical protein
VGLRARHALPRRTGGAGDNVAGGGVVICTTLRSRWAVLAIALTVVPARAARADEPAPPDQAPADPPDQASAGPPGSTPPTAGRPAYPPPIYARPVYVPPGYGPPIVNGPATITDFDDSQPVPIGYTPVSRRRKGLIIGGGCLFGAMYGYTALGALELQTLFDIEGSNTDVTALWIPVAGPFLELNQVDSGVGRFLLVVDGAAQALGAFMLLYGLTTPRTVLVRNDRLSLGPLIGPVIAPVITKDTSGLALIGRF